MKYYVFAAAFSLFLISAPARADESVRDKAPVVKAPVAEAYPAGAITPRAAAELVRLGIKLDEKDLLRVAETRSYWRQRAAAVWPGADISTITVGLMFAGKGTIVLAHPAPPKDCLPLAEDIPAAQLCRAPAPNLPVPTGKLYGGVPAVFLVTREECEKNKIEACAGSYADYSGTALHETFHAWQWGERQQAGVNYKGALLSPAWSTGRDSALFLALELKLLNDALAAGDDAAFKDLLLDYLAVRTARRALLSPADLAAENQAETTEGTAQYAGDNLEYGDNTAVLPIAATREEPDFRGYTASVLLEKLRLKSEKRLFPPANSQNFYVSGELLALVLDKLQPGWKNGFFRSQGKYLFGVLAGALPQASDPAARIQRVRTRYNADGLLAGIDAALTAIEAANRKKIDDFIQSPGRRYVFRFPAASAAELNIVGAPPVTGGQYKLYPYNFIVAVPKLNKPLKLAKSLPLLLDQTNLTLTAIIPEAQYSDPVISAAATETRGDDTYYSGEVSFDNGFFQWSGGALQVGSSGGTTTLTFPLEN